MVADGTPWFVELEHRPQHLRSAGTRRSAVRRSPGSWPDGTLGRAAVAPLRARAACLAGVVAAPAAGVAEAII
ncbi:hypothetical protein LT493_10235 [Streptomyces tricolor]|nr:hypothetical protein [Streptomyces tricolor]